MTALSASVTGVVLLNRTRYWPAARFAGIANDTVPPAIGAAGAVVTIAPINAGEVLSAKNLWVKRPGTGSIPAEQYESLLGRKAAHDIPADVHLALGDIV